MRKLIFPIAVLAWTLCAFGQETKPVSDVDTQPSAAAQQDLVATEPGTLLGQEKIPAGARVYVAPMPNGFENYVIAGLQRKKAPVIVVIARDKADYEISGVSQSEEAGWAKMLFSGSGSAETASVKMVNLKTGNVVFAYSFRSANSLMGKQSAGEACAKRIKAKIDTKEKDK